MYEYENTTQDTDVDDPPLNVTDEMFEPIYPGATLTICGAYCAIMHFKSTCRIPFTVVANLLQLLQLICPSQNKLPRTIYALRRFFDSFKIEKVKRRFCPTCHKELEINDAGALTPCNCSCPPIQEPDCLIHMDITKQLKTILCSKLLWCI